MVNQVAVVILSAVFGLAGALKLLGFGYYPPHAWIGFAVWGLLHAVAVSFAARRASRPPRGGAVLAAARLATFLFAALAWVPFFTPASVSWPGMARMLARMVLPIVP
jgi:hypothetical protein